MAKKDYYKILGVERSASKEEIRRVYRRLAKEWHPDRHRGSADAEARFKELSEAYAILSDDQKRRQYDLMGEAGAYSGGGEQFWDSFMRGRGGQAQGGVGPDGRTYTYENLGDLGDLFSQLFRGQAAREGTRQGAREERGHGEDVVTRVHIPFELSVKGGPLRVTLPLQQACSACGGSGAAPGGARRCNNCAGTGMVQMGMGGFAFSRPCPQCFGRGQVIIKSCPQCLGSGQESKRKSFIVQVPPGIKDGQRIRLAGQGLPGEHGAPGDLYVEVRVNPDERFRREGNDIYSDLAINLVQAALGTEVPVETVQGRVTVKIPRGTNSGVKLRLRGKGVVTSHGQAGDHYVVINVIIPKDLTEEQRKLLEKLADSAKLPR